MSENKCAVTVKDLCAGPIEMLVLPAPEKEAESVYCGDLLSWVMGRAPAGAVWCTVMANRNSLAVASLKDLAAVVFCEGAAVEPALLEKAVEIGLNLLQSPLPVYETARLVGEKAGHGAP